MPVFSRRLLVPFSVLLLLAFQSLVVGQEAPVVLAAKDLPRIVPAGFYFQGQSGPTQMRNAAAAKLGANRYVIAGLVDTSGYSSDVRGKYEGFFITDSSISVGGQELGAGAYGFGFSTDGKLTIFDVGGKEVLSVSGQSDKVLKRPRPLMMMKAADGLRLYAGRNYVTIAAR